MGSRVMYNNFRTTTPSIVMISGNFAPNGSSAIAASSVKGNGFAVAYTSTGLYTITLAEKWPSLLAAHFQIAMASATNLTTQIHAVSVSGTATNTISFYALAGATPTDIAADAANRIYFTLFLKNTALAA